MPKTNRKYAITAVAVFIGGTLALAPLFAKADPLDEYSAKEQQLSKKAGEVRSLSGEMALLDENIAAKQKYLDGVKIQSAKIRAELKIVNAELNKLKTDRDSNQEKLGEYVRTDYVDGPSSAYFVLASADSLSEVTSTSSYLNIFKSRTDSVVDRLDTLERRQSEKQRDVTNKVHQLDTMESEADKQARELEAVRQAKQRLLEQTKGQEDEYRKQYEEARKQLEKLGIFGGQACANAEKRVWPGDGNYFNQMDSRWADMKLGFSDSSTICNFGCGLASIAMVFKYYGIDTDPIRLNSDLRRVGAFWDDLLVWGNVSGASGGRLNVTKHFGANWNTINANLDARNPVIVYIDRGSSSHYVVLLERRGSTYIMNDPINGPNLRFSDYYSSGSVYEYVTFSRQ